MTRELVSTIIKSWCSDDAGFTHGDREQLVDELIDALLAAPAGKDAAEIAERHFPILGSVLMGGEAGFIHDVYESQRKSLASDIQSYADNAVREAVEKCVDIAFAYARDCGCATRIATDIRSAFATGGGESNKHSPDGRKD